MKNLTLLLVFFTCFGFSQDKENDKEQLLAAKKANDLVYEANALMDENNFISAEKEYRKAISKQPSSVAGTYNLGNSYFKKGNYEEALYRQQQAAKNATEKSQKHKAFHNIGNILMKNKQCKDAVEAYKNALRNDPTDDETRYNLGLAKECAEQQKDDQPDENQDKDKDKQDENKDQDNQDKDNQDQDNKENKDDPGDQDKKEGDDKKDEDKPKEEKEDKNQEQKPQPGKLSPQQIKNLLEAMNNQEQKVQEKMNADKQKGVKVQTEKDW
ncbi:tetratricopeptide repeat protein [Gelidibacter sp.]|uniref:tetratricopeptide repeat protein n=1 Tax=Gelidibacter sp. TaxID=2018083 RepID=UPI002BDB742E|nr:tetratricopeptide repeat protein [Gelidibacter sp.]HUH27776.1 tetratricopeptide repeat protein [Gelidibacter sp.]